MNFTGGRFDVGAAVHQQALRRRPIEHENAGGGRTALLGGRRDGNRNGPDADERHEIGRNIGRYSAGKTGISVDRVDR